MKLTRLLFKPKWQDKNAEVRRAAVASANDAELLATLPQIARTDADARVRLAALKRLDDYETWRERSTGDADGDVRRNARAAYLDLLCATGTHVPSLSRRIAELETLSPDEIEKIATHASDRDLRADALARVSRPALIAERAVADRDPAIRLAALDRIDDATTLERIAERARKTDKTVSRRARELLETRRIGSGDAAAIAQKARALCERMEMLVRTPSSDETIHAAILREWDTLGNSVSTDLIARYCGADALVRQTRINARNAAVVAAEATPATIVETAPVAPDPEALAAQARSEAALADASAEAQRERDTRRAHLHEMEQIVAPYAKAIETGTVSAAHAPHDRLLTLTAMVVPLPAALEAKLAPLHAQYAELKRHQLWANQRRREMLCDDVENLAQCGLHPDALALRVREAREEWQRLDAAEGAVGKSESGLARKFHAICHRALKPAKAYFDKRDELRKSHAGDIEKLLQEAPGPDTDIADWKAAGHLRQQLGAALRSLDSVDPRTRTALAARIKEALANLAPRLDAHADEVDAAKKLLVARAASLQRQTDGRSLARDARDLQQQWTALGQGRRGSDQRLWNEFRGAIDAAFGKIDAERKQREDESAAVRAQAEALLAQIAALGENADARADTVKAALRDIDARRQALPSVDRSFDQRYRQAREAVDSALRDAARRKRLSRFVQALEKYTLLRSVETSAQSADAIATQWHEISAPAEFFPALQARLDRATSPSAAVATDEDAARDLLVELEFFAGIQTPTEDGQRRMNFQVQRLAARLRDRSTATSESELAELMSAWFAQTPQAAALEDRFARGTAAAIETLP